MKQIPLRNKHKETVAYALVDDSDFDLVDAFNWHIHADGYAATNVPHPNGGFTPSNRKRRATLMMHRLILGISFGSSDESDHINRNPLDNRRVNLRVGTHALNMQNKGVRRGSISRFRGVTRMHGKWQARAMLNGESVNLGSFTDEDEAGRVAAEWRAKHMDFACNI